VPSAATTTRPIVTFFQVFMLSPSSSRRDHPCGDTNFEAFELGAAKFTYALAGRNVSREGNSVFAIGTSAKWRQKPPGSRVASQLSVPACGIF
jgi:hypothetical protein